ncbi:MAG: hypothetical protein JRH11_14785 [Deltaproteobacteria bacterium]|nr:hypothetical protein [Deltaproteobacteria bacterium]
MRRHSFTLTLAVALALVGFTGCAATTLDKDSGEEEAQPIEGKADGFRNPTEHGQLRLGNTASQAEITEDERFHAWNFSLSGDAEVTLTVGSRDRNLDTVAYLYHRDAPADNWGRYIKRNDDADDTTLQSAITGDFGAGDYRVIVKGFKDKHRGSFSLGGECDGAGCVSSVPTTGIEVPQETEFTEGCASILWESLDASVVSEDSFGISPTATSGYDREVLIATAHYADLSDYADYLDPDDALDFTFDVEITRTEKGTMVELADGGDESTTEYAFDADGNLIAYFVHNQSPWTGFYCGDGGAAAEYPDEECVISWMSGAPHDAGTEETGRVAYGWGSTVNALAAAAVAVYVESELEGVDGAIDIEFREWESYEGYQAGSYLLTARGGVAVEYAVVERWDGPVVIFASSENGDGPEMICAESD